MVIKKEDYNPVLIKFMDNISKGNVSTEVLSHFDAYKNSVLYDLNLSSDYRGLYDLFSYCEDNNIEHNSLYDLLSFLKNLNSQLY